MQNNRRTEEEVLVALSLMAVANEVELIPDDLVCLAIDHYRAGCTSAEVKAVVHQQVTREYTRKVWRCQTN